jgi:hypothetical protein
METEQKVKKTADKEKYMRDYMKEYRVKNKARLNNLERSRYFKNQGGMPPELMAEFGEISGLIYKLKTLYLEIIYQHPELAEKVIDELVKVEDGNI